MTGNASATRDPRTAPPGCRVVHISTVHPATDARILYREAQTLAELGYEVTVYGIHPTDTVLGGVAVRGLAPPRGRLRRIGSSWWRA